MPSFILTAAIAATISGTAATIGTAAGLALGFSVSAFTSSDDLPVLRDCEQ